MQNPFEQINTQLDEIENAILTLESEIKIHETALKKVVDILKTTTLSSAPKKRYLNASESAQYLGVSRSAIYQYIYRIPYTKKKDKLYFLNTDLDDYLKNKKR